MSARPARFAPDPARRALLAKVHLARKELGLEEADYRAILERVAGARSAAALPQEALEAVIAEFRRLGWQPGPAKRADHPAARKARGLWISLWQLGAVHTPSEAALEAFARRQLGCARLQWADQGQCHRLIEALKAMAERAGWSQDLAGVAPGFEAPALAIRLVRRLHEMAIAAGAELPPLDLMAGPGGIARASMAQLYGLARYLAAERRRAEAAVAEPG